MLATARFTPGDCARRHASESLAVCEGTAVGGCVAGTAAAAESGADRGVLSVRIVGVLTTAGVVTVDATYHSRSCVLCEPKRLPCHAPTPPSAMNPSRLPIPPCPAVEAPYTGSMYGVRSFSPMALPNA